MMNSFEVGKLADVENHLKCPLCHNTFSSPRILIGCGHTFCLSCLEIRFSWRNECPICKCSARTTDVVSSLALDAIVSAYRRFSCRTKNAQVVQGAPVDIARRVNRDDVNLPEAVDISRCRDSHFNPDMTTKSEKATTKVAQKEKLEEKGTDCEEELWNNVEVPLHRRSSARSSVDTFECVVRKPRSYRPVDIRTFTIDVRSSRKASEELDGSNMFSVTKTSINNKGNCDNRDNYDGRIRTLPSSGSASSSSSSSSSSGNSRSCPSGAYSSSKPNILVSILCDDEYGIAGVDLNVKQLFDKKTPVEELDEKCNTGEFDAEGNDTWISNEKQGKLKTSDRIEISSSPSFLDQGKLITKAVDVTHIDCIEEEAEAEMEAELCHSAEYPSALCTNTITGQEAEPTQGINLEQVEPCTGTYSLYRTCDSLCDESEDREETTPLRLDVTTSTRHTTQEHPSTPLSLPQSFDLHDSPTRWMGGQGQIAVEGERKIRREGEEMHNQTSVNVSGNGNGGGSGSASSSNKYEDNADTRVTVEERNRGEVTAAETGADSTNPILRGTDRCTSSALDAHRDRDINTDTDTVGGTEDCLLEPVEDDGCTDSNNMEVNGGGCDGSDDTYYESCATAPSSSRSSTAVVAADTTSDTVVVVPTNATAATTTAAAGTTSAALSHRHSLQGNTCDNMKAPTSFIRINSQESDGSSSFCNVTLTSEWSQNEESYAEGSSRSCADIVEKVTRILTYSFLFFFVVSYSFLFFLITYIASYSFLFFYLT
jgi:Zinc finger, C3HC4 type (RING finger)